MGQLKASRGVLVTTSWFGKQSHDFAAEHGRIQLIEGPHLNTCCRSTSASTWSSVS